ALRGHGYRRIFRALELGASRGASTAEVQEAHEPDLVALIVPVQAPLVVLVGRVLLCDPIGPVVQFGQPILAQRGDLVAAEDDPADPALRALKRDDKLLALRLVGRARLTAASTLSRF